MVERNMQNISSLDGYALRKERQKALCKWIQDWNRDECNASRHTYHITLATHQEIGLVRARHLLREWDARMNRAIVGREWVRRANQNNRWLAFPEGRKSDPHWHLVFCMSNDLPRRRRDRVRQAPFEITRKTGGRLDLESGLAALVDTVWADVTHRRGTTDTTLMQDIQGLASYITKEQHDAALFSSFVTSSDFKVEG